MTHNQKRNTQYILRISCCVFLFLVAGCTPTATATLFIPPTRVDTAPTEPATLAFLSPTPAFTATAIITRTPRSSATLEPSATPPPPSPTPPCVDVLQYLGDITIPDGTLVAPGQSLEKQWRVANTGSCDWDARYHLKLVEGYPALGAPNEITLYPARQGTQAILSVTFQAPTVGGVYRTAWQAVNPEGVPFGDAVFMEIVVQ